MKNTVILVKLTVPTVEMNSDLILSIRRCSVMSTKTTTPTRLEFFMIGVALYSTGKKEPSLCHITSIVAYKALLPVKTENSGASTAELRGRGEGLSPPQPLNIKTNVRYYLYEHFLTDVYVHFGERRFLQPS